MSGYIVYVDSGVWGHAMRKRYSESGMFVGHVVGAYEPVKYQLIRR